MHIGQIFTAKDLEVIQASQSAGAGATTQWWDLTGKFRAAADELERAYQQVTATAQYAAARPELKSRYDALMSRVASLRATIQSTLAQINRATEFFRSLVGLQGLGVVPVIAVAVIAAALAAVIKWTTDAALYLKMVSEQKRLEAAGVEPERAAQIAREGRAAGGLFSGIAQQLKWPLIFGIGALAVGWFLTRDR